MTTLNMDLDHLTESFENLSGDVLEIYVEEKSRAAKHGETEPEAIAAAMRKLLGLLRRLERNRSTATSDQTAAAHSREPLSAQELHELGDYGIRLLTELSEWADELKMEHHRQELENLTLPLAVWIVRCGGELSFLDPVVNSLASLANELTEPVELEQLYRYSTDIVKGTSPIISRDLDKSNPGRPWRVLLVNRAIIATRSHRPALMEDAFKCLLEHLPEEAPGFFREGMEQMDALQYPPHVKEVMKNYFQQWGEHRTLH